MGTRKARCPFSLTNPPCTFISFVQLLVQMFIIFSMTRSPHLCLTLTLPPSQRHCSSNPTPGPQQGYGLTLFWTTPYQKCKNHPLGTPKTLLFRYEECFLQYGQISSKRYRSTLESLSLSTQPKSSGFVPLFPECWLKSCLKHFNGLSITLK